MIIKLSDYVLEQSISDASINDIELEQLVAEMEVCCKLAMAYNKQLLMESYFQEADPPVKTTQTAAQPTQAESNQTTTPPKVDVIQQTNSMQRNIINPNKTDSEDGFFKTIFGYIKRFFRWIGLKLSGMSEDAYKNIRFIERYVMNATEQDLYEFIQKHKINIEMYNPDKVYATAKSIYNATKALSDKIGEVKNPNGFFFRPARSIPQFDAAIKQFTETIQQTEFTEPNDINDKVNQLQLFKQYIQGYADMITNQRKNRELGFVKTLDDCGKTFVKLQETIDQILSNKAYSSDDATAAAAQLKPMLANLQTSIKQASTKINSVVTAYNELKQFAVDISNKLKANSNDMNRGQIEKTWVNQQQ